MLNQQAKKPLLEIHDLNFSYNEDIILNNLNLTVYPGDFITITGENGSGKSSLLKLIIGALEPQGGYVKLWGEPPQAESAMRRLAYVPQNLAIRSVGFPITCREMVVLALQRDMGFFKIPRRKHYALAEKKLIAMGLAPYLKTPMKELSGGLQQRVMICRALMTDPELLVLDEPTAGVDYESKMQFMELLDRLHRELNVTILFVTHEIDVVKQLKSKPIIYRIQEGRLHHATV